MNKQQEQLDSIREMRTMMERSSRFSSLSGLAGVVVGVFAIVGILFAYLYLGISLSEASYYTLLLNEQGEINTVLLAILAADFILVLIASLIAGLYFSARKAKQQDQPVWDVTARRLLINLTIPLLAGGLYCLILLYHGQVAFIAPATLIFYGLALLNASRYTINDIRSLGIIEICIGLIASFFIGYGLVFWAFGFGVLHFVYGITIYLKYEK